MFLGTLKNEDITTEVNLWTQLHALAWFKTSLKLQHDDKVCVCVCLI